MLAPPGTCARSGPVERKSAYVRGGVTVTRRGERPPVERKWPCVGSDVTVKVGGEAGGLGAYIYVISRPSIEIVMSYPEGTVERIDEAYHRFETRVLALEFWLEDANGIYQETKGIRGSSLEDEKMFLIQDAALVFAASAFEHFVKTAVQIKTGSWPRGNVNGYKDAEEMLRKSYGIQLGGALKKRSWHLDFLVAFRHLIVHHAKVPDEQFRRRLSKWFGKDIAEDWQWEGGSDLDPDKVRRLIENVGSSVETAYREIRNSIPPE